MAEKYYTQGAERTYVLKWGHGKHLATLSTPTEHELRAVYAAGAGKPKLRVGLDGKPKDVEFDTAPLNWQEAAVANHLVKLAPPIEWRGKTIATGADAAMFAPTDIVSELAAEITIEASLDEEEKKTSEQPSTSSTQETSDVGTAKPASANTGV